MPPAETPPVATDTTHIAAPAHAEPSGEHASASVPPHERRRRWPWIAGLILVAIAAIFIVPWVREVLTSVSTDDAYVNGHVTQVAPRVAGQVTRVLVDDNNFVHQRDLLVELDPEPYQVQVNIAQSLVDVAKADLTAAQATVRGQEGLTRSLRFGLERSIEDVDDKIATLKLRVATLDAKRAAMTKAEADYNRNLPLLATHAVSEQQMDAYMEAKLVAQADVQQSLQAVYQIRVALGLPPKPEKGDDLTEVPKDLNQTFSFGAGSAGEIVAGCGGAGRGGIIHVYAEGVDRGLLQARSR